MRAPRFLACSSSSRITTAEPSDSTKPSRSLSNGREARVGSSLRVESAFIDANAERVSGVIAASAPPATMTSQSPRWMICIAMPMAWPLDAQADATEVLGPRRLNWIETLPAAALTMSRGTTNGLTRRGPVWSSLVWPSSIVSTPPMPEPMIVPWR